MVKLDAIGAHVKARCLSLPLHLLGNQKPGDLQAVIAQYLRFA
jgi:hypothetical protein